MDQVVLSLAFGSFIGFLLGLLGGGGSILTVPILVYVIGEDVHSAIGTSLAIVGASALLGVLAHSRRGNKRTNQKRFRLWIRIYGWCNSRCLVESSY